MPLYYAVERQNNRMVNLILRYMSKIPYCAIHHMDRFLHEMPIYHDFAMYLENAPSQTIQMLRKQTIKLD